MINQYEVDNTNFENIYELNSIDDFYANNDVQNIDLIPLDYFKENCTKNILHFFCIHEYVIKDFPIIYSIVSSLPLTNLEKNLLLVRFRRINIYCLKNFKSLSNYYTKSKLFIIICGILNPSLLSINHDVESSYYNLLFWTVWSLQLMVSLVTSFISFYKWDKKYFLYNSYKSKINQEIWYYLELTGKYGKSIINNDIENRKNIIIEANHKNKLSSFLENIENLFKKLKDNDLEIENSNEENSQDSKNKMKFIKSALENKNSPSSPKNKEFDIFSKQVDSKNEDENNYFNEENNIHNEEQKKDDKNNIHNEEQKKDNENDNHV
jgi:hypothetical protein